MESAQAPICARGHDAPMMARANRTAEPQGCQQGKPAGPQHKESNDPAKIIRDMRHMSRYSAG
jgi:hypothetical protein